jgi:putative transcriptional regulator
MGSFAREHWQRRPWSMNFSLVSCIVLAAFVIPQKLLFHAVAIAGEPRTVAPSTRGPVPADRVCLAFPDEHGAMLPGRIREVRTGVALRGGRKPAKGKFLIARRGLPDPNFSKTVVLLIGYDEEGAMGLVVNRPTSMALSSVLPGFDESRDHDGTLFLGGPVARLSVFLLLRADEKPKESTHIFASVYMSASKDTLRDKLQRRESKESMRVYAGYAGWGAGQLERELGRGDWYVAAADAVAIFDKDPADVWPDLVQRFEGPWAGAPLWPSGGEEESSCPTRLPG